MKIETTRTDAYQLFHSGVIALSDVEKRGIRIDRPYCRKTIAHLSARTGRMHQKLLQNEHVKRWQKKEGSAFKLASNPQLAKYLYQDLGLKAPVTEEMEEETEFKKNIQLGPVDEAALRLHKMPWLMEIVKWRKLKHAADQLDEIMREQVGGFLHPMFSLGGSTKDSSVRSYRSSCEHINFQNKSARDREMAELVRRAFIPRKPTNVILEADFKGLEVGTSCCVHHDPNMISYVKNPKKDMHRDQAMACFLLAEDEVSKPIRHVGKNGFVFPEFYGSYWKNVAPAMWRMIEEMKLELVSGKKLKAHLKEKGIPDLSRFTRHVKGVEYEFWNELYSGATIGSGSF